MESELLQKSGQALYGERWKSEIARDLAVDVRRIRQWLAGTRPIPVGIWPEIEELLSQRMEILDHVHSTFKH